MREFRAGYATILGKPNAGKSTLLNAIVREKLAIVTAKPQTTRDRLSGIYNDDRCQIVFVDTPGVVDPKDRFNECLMREIHEALNGVDVVLHLIDVNDPDPLPPEMRETLARVKAPVFLVVNKIDIARPRFGKSSSPALSNVEGSMASHAARTKNDPQNDSFDWSRFEAILQAAPHAERFAISALQRTGVDELIEAVIARLPEGQPFYDPDQLSDRDLRYLAAERVREKIFELTHQEIPYGAATRTEEFREEPGRKPYILVNVFVEHDSQKGILVGQGAAMIRKIGQEARREIEELVGEPVFLELQVKVRKNWRKNDAVLRELGYALPGKKSKR